MTMDPKTAEYVLLLYAQKELGRKKAMFYLGVGYAELLQLVADRGLAVPVLDDAEIDTMATTFAAVLESRRNQLAFVIPDGGPIIRLAIGDRLDVLLALQLPLYIVDQVKREMVRDSGREDARRIATFFANNADIIHELETSVSDDEGADAAAPARPQQKGLTLRAVDEAWSRVDAMAAANGPILVVLEDGDVRSLTRRFRDNVHILSTKALLVGMERRGLIPSAADVWSAITPVARPSLPTAAAP